MSKSDVLSFGAKMEVLPWRTVRSKAEEDSTIRLGGSQPVS